jgi:hypothetical protein
MPALVKSKVGSPKGINDELGITRCLFSSKNFRKALRISSVFKNYSSSGVKRQSVSYSFLLFQLRACPLTFFDSGPESNTTYSYGPSFEVIARVYPYYDFRVRLRECQSNSKMGLAY